MKSKILTILFFTVSLKGLLLGGYHLYLPTHWHWAKGLTETPEMLRWALLAINDMWSILMILLHGGLLYCFREGMEKQRYQLGFILASYWLLHAMIISINPMPMPAQLQSMLKILLIIPYLQFLILAAGSWNTRFRLMTVAIQKG